jgi:hypothetical protein
VSGYAKARLPDVMAHGGGGSQKRDFKKHQVTKTLTRLLTALEPRSSKISGPNRISTMDDENGFIV